MINTKLVPHSFTSRLGALVARCFKQSVSPGCGYITQNMIRYWTRGAPRVWDVTLLYKGDSFNEKYISLTIIININSSFETIILFRNCRRTVNSNRPILECSNDLKCKIDKHTRKRCQYCRFEVRTIHLSMVPLCLFK